MIEETVKLLVCPTCEYAGLHLHCLVKEGAATRDGVVCCQQCRAWYPIDNHLLELLPPNLAYQDDRQDFWHKHRSELERLTLQEPAVRHESSAAAAQQKQQQYFDQWANAQGQSYREFGEMPFWKAVNAFDIAEWRKEIRPGKWFLDVGCAQGRTTFKFLDLPIKMVGFDISKASIRQAIDQYRSAKHQAEAVFFVGDATRLPFQDSTFDYAMLYGVLHHLPDPEKVCRQVARILRPGGIYFGTENNKTALRPLFDFLQKLIPLWHEEAGEQPLISRQDLGRWFSGTDVRVKAAAHVFVPPHLVNLLGKRLGKTVLLLTDWLLRKVPVVGRNGGLIMIRGQRAA